MKKCGWMLGILVISLGVLTGCVDRTEDTGIVTTGVGETSLDLEEGASQVMTEDPSFSNFKTITLDGDAVTEEIFADYDLTMINIWATFCGPCLREMPDLGEISEEYEDKNFQIAGIVTDVMNSNGTLSETQLETAREIVDKTEADYIHLLPSYDLTMAKLKDVTSVPETIFVDRDGNQVGESYLGSRSKEDWVRIIDELLDEVK